MFLSIDVADASEILVRRPYRFFKLFSHILVLLWLLLRGLSKILFDARLERVIKCARGCKEALLVLHQLLAVQCLAAHRPAYLLVLLKRHLLMGGLHTVVQHSYSTVLKLAMGHIGASPVDHLLKSGGIVAKLKTLHIHLLSEGRALSIRRAHHSWRVEYRV